MNRKFILMLPLYMLAMLLAAVAGLIFALVILITALIKPSITKPIADASTQKVMGMASSMMLSSMRKRQPTQ